MEQWTFPCWSGHKPARVIHAYCPKFCLGVQILQCCPRNWIYQHRHGLWRTKKSNDSEIQISRLELSSACERIDSLRVDKRNKKNWLPMRTKLNALFFWLIYKIIPKIYGVDVIWLELLLLWTYFILIKKKKAVMEALG